LSNPDAYYRCGTDEVRLVVDPRARRVPIVVRVAGDGTPVEEFGISVGTTYLPSVASSSHEKPSRGRFFDVLLIAETPNRGSQPMFSNQELVRRSRITCPVVSIARWLWSRGLAASNELHG